MNNQFLLFLDIGGPEMMLILVAGLLLFGGQKLPELARGLGKGIRDFKDAANGVKEDINESMNKLQDDKYLASGVPGGSPAPHAEADPTLSSNTSTEVNTGELNSMNSIQSPDPTGQLKEGARESNEIKSFETSQDAGAHFHPHQGQDVQHQQNNKQASVERPYIPYSANEPVMQGHSDKT